MGGPAIFFSSGLDEVGTKHCDDHGEVRRLLDDHVLMLRIEPEEAVLKERQSLVPGEDPRVASQTDVQFQFSMLMWRPLPRDIAIFVTEKDSLSAKRNGETDFHVS